MIIWIPEGHDLYGNRMKLVMYFKRLDMHINSNVGECRFAEC
jgi:hypothetical protein